jgi:hypothetical protein
MMLASCGGVAGLAVSLGARQVLSTFYSTDSEGFHHFYDLSFDGRILVYSVGLAVITGMLFGLVPALRASRQNLVVELKEGGSTGQSSRGWLRDALVIGQLALSMLLVISSGLLIRSVLGVQRGTNFDPEHVVVLRLRPELTKYKQPQIESLVQQVHQRLNAAPGIQSVGFMQGGEGLVWDWSSGREVQVGLSRQPETLKEGLTVRKQDVTENFFSTLKIPLLQGREFGEQDRPGTLPVAIVNEALTRRVWPTGSAIGRTLFVNAEPFQVIGVAADVQPQNCLHAPEPHLYLSYWQSNATREGDIRFAFALPKSQPWLCAEFGA